MQEVLELPDTVRNPKGLDKFLWGIPFLGIDYRAVKRLRKVQAARTASEMIKWSAFPYLLVYNDFIGKILVNELSWKNTYFLPHDKCRAMFFHPYVEEAIIEIEEKYECFMDILESNDKLLYSDLLLNIHESILAHN